MIVASSPQLTEAAYEVLGNADHCIMKIECVFYNGDTGYSYTPEYIEILSIDQQFATNYMDYISLTVKFPPKDYLELLNNYQNLRCDLTLFKYNVREYDICYDKLPIKLENVVIINNHADLLKQFSEAQLMSNDENPTNDTYQSMRIPLQMQLFDVKAYELRQVKINTLFKNTPIMDVIYYIVEALGIENTVIVPFDNTEARPEILIPPIKSIADIFDNLQKEYGLYSKGLDVYYTMNTLYIYPSYETDPKQVSKIGHIYNLPENALSGGYGYHSLKENDVHVVCNTGANLQEAPSAGIENTGNTILMHNSDGVYDARSSTTNMGTELKQNIVALEVNNSTGAKSNVNNVVYQSPTNNVFSQSSKMASFGGGNLTIGWLHAEPFVLVPGMKIMYHYDAKESYQVHIGILKSAQYIYAKHNPNPSYPIHACKSVLNIRLNPFNKDGQ